MAHNTSIQGRFESWGALETTLLWVNKLGAGDEARSFPSYPSLGLYVEEGEVVFEFDSVERYQAGMWVFPKKDVGVYRLGADSKVLAVRFFVKWPSGMPLFDRTETAVFSGPGAKELTKAARALTQYAFKHGMLSVTQGAPRLKGTLGDYIMLQARFADWVAAYYSTFVKHGHEEARFSPLTARMRESLRYLRNRSLATPFHERELAEHAGVSLSQICKIFIQEIGMTPQSYWNTRRIGVAVLDLTDMEKSIKEIAYSLGFSSQGHFSTWFQKQSGCTPREFRNREAGSDLLSL